ncbi:hypothetical protein AWB79_04334 [Caballeronia hypogeia]|uniref:Glycosyltransferase RgtA/B/C/D-like domain-containing protein n=1 Tax=Caballeronia hypogeia TaxID=1777140 RepID=A0A158BX57_9BURK|nr:hypothetical protein [Caballeronia hypogeia]SAK74236.1 hypothetical protein AWB79_04334 [Caballeronia hypogeia]
MSIPPLGLDSIKGLAIRERGVPPIARILIVVTVLMGMGLFWVAPRLPLCDLPQHAGQVALLRDLIANASPWESVVRVNYFTPYLTGYGLALLLSYAMPITTAFKVLLSAAYLAFVGSLILLRKHFGGDERLDWLFLPSFFGFAFSWGFVTFLVAAPIGILFILVADRYAQKPDLRRAFGLVAIGVLLFFSHGLVFLYACAAGALALYFQQRRLSAALRHIGPFALLASLAACYALFTYENDPLLVLKGYLPHTIWGAPLLRPFNFLRLSLTSDQRVTQYPLLVLLVAILFAAPTLLGARINRHARSAIAPCVVVVGVFACAPSVAMKTAFLYERFGLFVLPAYALMFRAPDAPAANGQSDRLAPRTRSPIFETAAMLLLAAGCWVFLAWEAGRIERFAAESAPFETILDSMQPGQRALSLVFQRNSEAFDDENSYSHYPVWYQAERHGFVDVNFAWYLPQIARFRSGELPAVSPSFEFHPGAFDWNRDQGRRYRYFVVRSKMRLPPEFLANRECDVQLIRTAGEWSLYERKECQRKIMSSLK